MSENVFSSLSENQYKLLKDALSYITILIAGADGQIDESELNWAEKLTHIRTYAKPEELNAYYQDVEGNFEGNVQSLLKALPVDLKAREEILVKKLQGLNEILASLENSVAFQLYESFTSFSLHIAKASGGFLRFGAISSKEKRWVNLPMIEPVLLIIEDADEEESE